MKELRTRSRRAQTQELNDAKAALTWMLRREWLDRRRGRVLGIELGPDGWLCPSWWHGTLFCAQFKDIVFFWNPDTMLFDKAKGVVPPWERDHRELAAEGL